MRTDHFDPYTVGEALASQVIRLASHIRDQRPPDPATAGIIRNVAASAQAALSAGGECLKKGDVEAALWSIGAAEGAMGLITGLLTSPDDPLVATMAAPFTLTNEQNNVH